jgi:hypothetical protein
MGLLSRVFGSRPDESAVTAAVGEAVARVPGVGQHSLSYHHRQYGGGSLTGVVDVADSPTFLAVLRAAVAALSEAVGDDVDRVTFYLSGRTPDGEPVVPGDLGTSQPPLGKELRSRLAP